MARRGCRQSERSAYFRRLVATLGSHELTLLPKPTARTRRSSRPHRQARANARVAGAPLLPTVEGSGSGARRYNDIDTVTQRSTGYQTVITTSYEIDIWGKNAAGLQGAEAAVDANVYDRDAILLVLQTDVATTYFSILAFQDRLVIARNNLSAAQELLRLVDAVEQGAQRAGRGTAEDTVAAPQILQLQQQIL
jgi:outer membrane protein TolC